jgi:hypothetical protein
MSAAQGARRAGVTEPGTGHGRYGSGGRRALAALTIIAIAAIAMLLITRDDAGPEAALEDLQTAFEQRDFASSGAREWSIRRWRPPAAHSGRLSIRPRAPTLDRHGRALMSLRPVVEIGVVSAKADDLEDAVTAIPPTPRPTPGPFSRRSNGLRG